MSFPQDSRRAPKPFTEILSWHQPAADSRIGSLGAREGEAVKARCAVKQMTATPENVDTAGETAAVFSVARYEVAAWTRSVASLAIDQEADLTKIGRVIIRTKSPDDRYGLVTRMTAELVT